MSAGAWEPEKVTLGFNPFLYTILVVKGPPPSPLLTKEGLGVVRF